MAPGGRICDFQLSSMLEVLNLKLGFGRMKTESTSDFESTLVCSVVLCPLKENSLIEHYGGENRRKFDVTNKQIPQN
jgi:hypothetical protein